MSVCLISALVNCGTPNAFTETSPGQYEVAPKLPDWDKDQFCQVVSNIVILGEPRASFEVTVDVFNNRSVSHSGIAFNYVDQHNYDYFFIR